MTPSYTTTTHGLRWLTGGNLVSDIDAGFQSLAEDVDTKLLTGGKSIIATSETRTASTYGLLATPDRVQSIILPTDGILQIRYLAQWNQSTNVAASAAIFIGATQLTASTGTGATDPSVAVTGTGSTFGVDHWLSSYWNGLISDTSTAGASPSAPVTTGQIVGSYSSSNVTGGAMCEVFAAAGTYDISVQFKTTSGTLTVKNRKLWVRVIAF